MSKARSIRFEKVDRVIKIFERICKKIKGGRDSIL